MYDISGRIKIIEEGIKTLEARFETIMTDVCCQAPRSP